MSNKITVKHTKPWTPETLKRMLFCCKEKANKAWETNPNTATVISL